MPCSGFLEEPSDDGYVVPTAIQYQAAGHFFMNISGYSSTAELTEWNRAARLGHLHGRDGGREVERCD
jgi:hypothetical protein